ncbi:hypothetical protein [Paludisphaera mucosa]|uniref:Delta-60 repeat domain-containing protein n=1 Tax=Paludisphaera mucosa TaxID=3030827 RepID=A0ABT6FL38_9BACT|nr:hypothetical protein [Paludisphaera mucosa]MDG3008288.1 hypothetical protein [Paludisphaera mucosa]
MAGSPARGDEHPFTIELREVVGVGAPGLQSFAVGRTADGRWVCIGGRLAGLHDRRSPGNPPPLTNFDRRNESLWVIDPVRRRARSRPLADLVPPDAAVSLAVVNPQAAQVGDRLYLAGGFGLGPGGTAMTTHRRLTVVDLSAAADAVEGGGPIGSHIRQSAPDDFLRVTGGEMLTLDGTFYLVFGQRFDRNYVGEDDRGGTYTHQVRPFRVEDTGAAVSILKGTPTGTSTHDGEFRRRDLNAIVAVRGDGRPGITAFGGVFRPNRDSETGRHAWTRPIDIDPGDAGPSVRVDPTGFRQQLSHYNCATLTVREPTTRTTATVFFGGISEVVAGVDGAFRPDAELPFVDHVSCVTRRADGSFSETLVCRGVSAPPAPLRLPGLLGAGARFVPADPSLFAFDALQLDRLRGNVVVGHIYGGISASTGNGGTTRASDRIFEVVVGPRPSSASPVPVVLSRLHPVDSPSKSPR